MIRVGNIEFRDWIKAPDNPTPYRFIGEPNYTLSGFDIGYVCINYSSVRKWFADFSYDLQWLDATFPHKEYNSYEEAQDHVDQFLIRMSKLLLFI